jgi:hypothetical protein
MELFGKWEGAREGGRAGGREGGSERASERASKRKRGREEGKGTKEGKKGGHGGEWAGQLAEVPPARLSLPARRLRHPTLLAPPRRAFPCTPWMTLQHPYFARCAE